MIIDFKKRYFHVVLLLFAVAGLFFISPSCKTSAKLPVYSEDTLLCSIRQFDAQEQEVYRCLVFRTGILYASEKGKQFTKKQLSKVQLKAIIDKAYEVTFFDMNDRMLRSEKESCFREIFIRQSMVYTKKVKASCGYTKPFENLYAFIKSYSE